MQGKVDRSLFFCTQQPVQTSTVNISCDPSFACSGFTRIDCSFATPPGSHYFGLCIPIASLRQTSSEHGAQAARCPADPPPLVSPSPFTPPPNPSHTPLSPLVPRHSFQRSSPIDTTTCDSPFPSFFPSIHRLPKHECLTKP